MEPAYLQRGWNQAELDERKSDLASGQADCLGWDLYSPTEKKEISDLLLQLSSSNKVKTMIWLYGNGFGNLISVFSRAIAAPKSLAKKVIISINSAIKGGSK